MPGGGVRLFQFLKTRDKQPCLLAKLLAFLFLLVCPATASHPGAGTIPPCPLSKGQGTKGRCPWWAMQRHNLAHVPLFWQVSFGMHTQQGWAPARWEKLTLP